ncbi:Protein of unknown function [Pyronema omphalodes CBS 100304]|uniref:Uncharacterized protein n=1 Tax=Pyronema omphalodes (strain CBS 100304) TaxID=1076935 RepID=U4L2G9_PYROM|nr:Protein of unknown function [Pyronema omphalodes CBS 100304]
MVYGNETTDEFLQMPVGVERKPRLKGTKSGTNVILHRRKERERRTIYEQICNGKTYGNMDETN